MTPPYQRGQGFVTAGRFRVEREGVGNALSATPSAGQPDTDQCESDGCHQGNVVLRDPGQERKREASRHEGELVVRRDGVEGEACELANGHKRGIIVRMMKEECGKVGVVREVAEGEPGIAFPGGEDP
jgi:hypothetical protein